MDFIIFSHKLIPIWFDYWSNTAPIGYVIKLDFRNRFNIEPSTMCEYDFLEVNKKKLDIISICYCVQFQVNESLQMLAIVQHIFVNTFIQILFS